MGLDIENTGWDLTKHAIVQIGLSVWNVVNGKRKKIDSFSVLINVPADREWEERCVTEFWNKSPELVEMKRKIDNKEGKEPETAMQEMVDFSMKCFKDYAYSNINNIRFIVDTVSFDACWVNLYLAQYIGSKPLHLLFGGFRDLIETGSYMQGRSGITHDDELELIKIDEEKRKDSGKEGRGHFSCEESCFKKRKITETALAEHNHDAESDAANIVETYLIVMYSKDPSATTKKSKK